MLWPQQRFFFCLGLCSKQTGNLKNISQWNTPDVCHTHLPFDEKKQNPWNSGGVSGSSLCVIFPLGRWRRASFFFLIFIPIVRVLELKLLIVSYVSRGSGSAEVARWVTGSSDSRAWVEASPSAGTSRLWERHILKTQRKKQQDRPRFGSAAGWTEQHGRRTSRLLRVDKVADSSSRWVVSHERHLTLKRLSLPGRPSCAPKPRNRITSSNMKQKCIEIHFNLTVVVYAISLFVVI